MQLPKTRISVRAAGTIALFAMIVLAASCGAGSGPVSQSAQRTDSAETPEQTTALQIPSAAESTRTSRAATAIPGWVKTITAVDEFPVLWLGTSYDSGEDGFRDLPLTLAIYQTVETQADPATGIETSPARIFHLGYGGCPHPPGDQPCAGQLDIVFFPPDARVKTTGDSEGLTVRGVDAEEFGGVTLVVPTADFTLLIGAWGDQALRVANRLLGANPKAAGITKDSKFHAKASATATPRP